MGPGITINPNTGVVSGIAPGIGIYVLSVVAKEYRNGVYIGESRKSLHIQVASCNPLSTQLDPDYLTCDGFTLTFSNKSTNPAGADFFWDFGDPKSGTQNTSTLSNPIHTYSDTGIFTLKLRVSLKGQCTDSTTSIVKVYPGFLPDFISMGQCKNAPIQFNDKSQTVYGVINSWSWDFGDAATLSDTSHAQNPSYRYNATGNYDVSLIITNSKGCIDTITKTVIINDKPDFTITNDTLICSIDTLQLNTYWNREFFMDTKQ
ncbi:MAG: PKD domain-containing protein [Chitinophagaceae bacterium]